jgi:hypothetical protein
MDPAGSPRLGKKPGGKKRLTDPFQVFCTENRSDIAAQNPKETVGGVTSILASMWRSMTTDKKMVYIEFAREFDRAQAARRRPKMPAIPPQHDEILLPFIHVVRRGISSQNVEAVSLNSMGMPGPEGLSGSRHPCVPVTGSEPNLGDRGLFQIGCSIFP